MGRSGTMNQGRPFTSYPLRAELFIEALFIETFELLHSQ